MKEKSITIDELAQMIAKGFSETASKADLGKVNGRLDKIDTRLDRIENILLRDHLNRIEKLEDSVRVLKTKAGVA